MDGITRGGTFSLLAWLSRVRSLNACLAHIILGRTGRNFQSMYVFYVHAALIKDCLRVRCHMNKIQAFPNLVSEPMPPTVIIQFARQRLDKGAM